MSDPVLQYPVRWQQHPFDAIMTLIDGVNHLLSKSLAPVKFEASANESLITLTLQPTTPATPMPVIEVPKPSIEQEIAIDKALRRDIDTKIQELKSATPSRERSLAVTKLQEAVMWLGMDLKRIGEENPGYAANPYPNSKDPSTTVIDKTADGLKL